MRRLQLSLLIVVVAAAGCADGDGEPSPAPTLTTVTAASPDASSPPEAETTPSPTAEPSPTAQPSPTGTVEATEAPFSANTRPDTAEVSGDGRAVVTDVRAALHDGFDRVVFEIGGDLTVGWRGEYVDEPTSQGSGDPVAVEGEAVLRVTLEGISYPGDAPSGVESYDGPRSLTPPGTRVVQEIVDDTLFEGRHEFFVGMSQQLPFRIRRVDSPQRVVLEVIHPGLR